MIIACTVEAGRARQVWAEAQHTVESKISGPHFEALAADWVARYAPREAKHRDRRPGLAELRRLQHLRDLLTAAVHDASDAVAGVFSTAGFTDDLAAEAAVSRGKILLATLGELYDQQS